MNGESGYKSCTQVMESEVARVFAPEKRSSFFQTLSREKLILAYQKRGNRWLMYEYRRIDQDGDIRWVSCAINLYQHKKSKDIRIAMWISQLDKRRQWESKFDLAIGKDPISKLYTRSTVRDISMSLLEQREDKLCALVMIEIGGMTQMYSKYSGDMGEKWKSVITALLLAIGTSCIPGQFGIDRYILFFPEVMSEEKLKGKLEQAILFVRRIISDEIEGSVLRFLLCGICCCQKEADYNVMMKMVQDICQLWTNSSGDRVIFADENQEENCEQLRREESDQIRFFREESSRPLSEHEKDAAFQCMLMMMNVETLEDSARCVLRTLGEYYEADRVYILLPSEPDQIVTMPHEWTSEHKRSIQQAVSGSLISKFPILEQCMREENFLCVKEIRFRVIYVLKMQVSICRMLRCLCFFVLAF